MPTYNGDDTNNIIIGDNSGDTINGLGGDDQLIGGTGDDTLNGGTGHDVLTGGAGHDILNGGPDSDTYKDTIAGLNGDEITDLKSGDKIQITDLPAYNADGSPNANVSINGNTLSFHGGSVTVDHTWPGRYVVRAIGNTGTEIRAQQDAHNDFTGDGLSDILLHNDDGTVTDWVAQPGGGFANNSANFQINASSNWHVAGTGDFNGDGKVDILWRADDGTVTDWLGQSNGSFSNNWANFTINASSNWHVIGTGDFNGDGISDILWRADDGTVTDWLGQSNGSFSSNGANFTINASSNWHVIGTGDFNGDGISDILWRADDGTVTDWLGQSNGSFSSNGANFTIHASSNWHVIGTGDFNGDGTTDILWRADDGTITDWLGQSNGGFAQNWANFHIQATSNWKIVGTGDFNGDAVDDIIWRSDSGQISDWFGQANGALAPTAQNYNTTVDPHWHVQPEVTLI